MVQDTRRALCSALVLCAYNKLLRSTISLLRDACVLCDAVNRRKASAPARCVCSRTHYYWGGRRGPSMRAAGGVSDPSLMLW